MQTSSTFSTKVGLLEIRMAENLSLPACLALLLLTVNTADWVGRN